MTKPTIGEIRVDFLRRCRACGCRVMLHRRGKPLACKTCGAKQRRTLS